MIIAQISDSHITANGEMAASRVENLAACVKHINASRRQPNIIVHSGDLTHDDLDEEYQTALDIMGALKAPLYFIPGNRDDSEHMRRLYSGRFPLTENSEHFCYTIKNHAVHLIALDTTSNKTGLGQFCEARAEFMQSALSECGDKPALIFMHHPPYEVPSSFLPREFDNWQEVELLEKILTNHPGKIRVISGHVHRNSFGNIGEIATSSMPSIALDLRRKNDPLVVPDEIMYHIHEFGPDGHCATRLVRVPLEDETADIMNPVPGGMAV